MPKRIGSSDIIGERGIAHIRQVVLSMGFMFYETGGVEAGIDGIIELRDVATGTVGNLLLQVQGKATERRRLQGETDVSFEFPCSDDDIAYWMQGTAPVLLIIVSLEEGKAYWKSIKAWFSDPNHRKSRKVVFDKVIDEFNRDAKAAIAALATSVSPGASMLSVRKHEELLANLCSVNFASRLYWAPTAHSTDKSFGGALRELTREGGSEWIVRSNAVLSFHDLDQSPWNKLCEVEAMEEFDVNEWANSDDSDRQRDFVALLNRAIGEFVRPDLYRNPESGVFYFCKLPAKNELNYAYHSAQNMTTRRVVGQYGKSRKNPAQASYWRHSAFAHRFVRYAGKWFLEVTPTYHFTRDGRLPDSWAGEHLKKIKEFENNAAVLGQFLMWRHFLLTHRSGDLLRGRYPFLSFAAVDPLKTGVGVTDELWKSQEADPSSPLFDLAQVEDRAS